MPQKPKVITICISPTAGTPMQEISEVEALAGLGLKGDRYAEGRGSFNKDKPGRRQVTLINAAFFPGSGFTYAESRRNIVTEGVELMWLIGREFQIGEAVFKGVKYCDPCDRPTGLAKKDASFREAFHDRGGLVAEIVKGGIIKVGDPIIPPPKGY